MPELERICTVPFEWYLVHAGHALNGSFPTFSEVLKAGLCALSPAWVLMATQGPCVRQVGRKDDLGNCFKDYCLAIKSCISLDER